MKKFLMITPHQPVTKEKGDLLHFSHYTPSGNCALAMEGEIRFPLLAVIHAYAHAGEEIRIITVTSDLDFARTHLQQLREDVASLQAKKGFLLPKGVESVDVTYSGDVSAQVEIFDKLIPYFAAEDELYACLTFGLKPMSFALLSCIKYAYQLLEDVMVECLVYGGVERSDKGNIATIYDITALAELDEVVRMLAQTKPSTPMETMRTILGISTGEEEGK